MPTETSSWCAEPVLGPAQPDPGAGDIVVGSEHQADATRFLTEMRDRLAAFGLTLHGEKTRLIRFGRFAAANRRERGESKPETFNLLGLTHICGHNRDGRF